jgi:hypothetical protein
MRALLVRGFLMMLSAQCRPGTPVSCNWQKTVYYPETDCRSDVPGALLPREMLEKLEQGELEHTREENTVLSGSWH